jgi:hypothetical protein
MNGPELQAKLYAGYVKAALRLGTPYLQYRPTGPANPIASGNLVQSLTAAFDPAPGFEFHHPALFGKPVWYALLDGTQTVVGDYLVGSAGTYFIAAMQPLLPIAAVLCNRVLTINRPAGNAGVGAQPYGGVIAGSEAAELTAWPASVLTKSRGEMGDTRLPGDVKLPWSEILLPYGGIELRFGDVILDDNAVRYTVSATERTDLGWRLLAVQTTA